MKKKYLATVLGIAMTASMLGSSISFAEETATEAASDVQSGATESTSENTDQADENTIYGEVTAVDDTSITIDVGTLSESGMGGAGDANGQPPEMPSGDASQGAQPDAGQSSEESGSEDTSSADETASSEADTSESSSESASESSDTQQPPDMPSGSAPSGMGGVSIEKTGESQTITITDSTVITEQSGGMGGQAPSDAGNGQAPSDAGQSEAASEGTSSDSSESASSDSTTESASEGGAPADAGSGQAPADMGSGETTEISLSDIEVGDIVAVTLNDDGTAAAITVQNTDMGGGMGGGQGTPGSSDNSSVSYTAANEYSESTDISGEEITSTGTDENAVLVDGADAEVSISDSTITRDSDDSTGGDNSSFYGVGAAALATDGTLYIDDSTITTDAKGGAGAFAYGDGTVYIADTTISTNQDTSGGVHVAGGGTLYAWDLNVATNGESSAAIRSDRGSGTEVIDGGTYTSNGEGSPAIYSTADITVNDAELTANGSEAICIEGLNTIRLFDCDLTGNMSDLDQNDTTWNVIVYQSMSGDSEEGNGTFEMVGGTLTAENGGMFYTTNTQSTITLDGVDITYSDDNPFFLQCTGNTNQRGWGEAGNNGADCLFTAIEQSMEGNVIWDSISSLDFYMTDGSSLSGAFVDDETYAGDGGDGYANVYIDSTSTWTVTGDSTVTNLFNEGTIVDEDGNTVSIVGTDGTVYVEGDSDYTITVTSYSDSADMSGASSAPVYSDYAVEEPSQFTEA